MCIPRKIGDWRMRWNGETQITGGKITPIGNPCKVLISVYST